MYLLLCHVYFGLAHLKTGSFVSLPLIYKLWGQVLCPIFVLQAHLFIFFTVSFDEQKFLISIMSKLSVLLFDDDWFLGFF